MQVATVLTIVVCLILSLGMALGVAIGEDNTKIRTNNLLCAQLYNTTNDYLACTKRKLDDNILKVEYVKVGN